MTKIYYESDAPLNALKGKTVAIIGYGSQGHSQAQNLRESGVNVIVSELEGTDNYDLAVKHGFKPVNAADAAKQGDIIQILLPDEIQAKIYQSDIKANLSAGKALCFSHGFNIHFGQIVPPKGVDVFMVAPKGPGHLVRSEYEKGGGVPCLFAVYQDESGKCRDIALAYANGIGGARAGVLETTFKEETETDLFGEQAVLCGGAAALIKAGFDTLVEAGYQPELVYFEVLHELKLIVDLLYEGGLSWMRYSVSNTAEYGDLTRGPRLVNDDTRAEMKKILTEIQTGQFAKEWLLECSVGKPTFNAMELADREHKIEQVGRKLRKMMKWIDAKEPK